MREGEERGKGGRERSEGEEGGREGGRKGGGENDEDR